MLGARPNATKLIRTTGSRLATHSFMFRLDDKFLVKIGLMAMVMV